MREDGEELVLRTVGRLGVRARLLRLRVQPGVLARQLLGLGARGPLADERPALADVADRAGDQHPLLGLERAQTDLHRELRAVSPQPVELEARPHGAHPRLLEVGEAVLRVVAAEALGDEHLHGLAEELVPAIAEQSLRLRVHQDDPSRALDDDHRVGSRLQEPAELPLDLLAVRDVADDARDDHPVPSLERGEADLGRELAAVLAAAGEVQAHAHRARPRVHDVAGAVPLVGSAHALGEEDLDGLVQQLVPPVPEDLLGLRVDEHDAPLVVDPDDGVGSVLEQVAEPAVVASCNVPIPADSFSRRDSQAETLMSHGQLGLSQPSPLSLAHQSKDQ